MTVTTPKMDLDSGVVDFPKRETPGFKSGWEKSKSGTLPWSILAAGQEVPSVEANASECVDLCPGKYCFDSFYLWPCVKIPYPQ